MIEFIFMEKIKAERATYQATGSRASLQIEISKMSETIFWWVFTLACVFAFFFSYGMV